MAHYTAKVQLAFWPNSYGQIAATSFIPAGETLDLPTLSVTIERPGATYYVTIYLDPALDNPYHASYAEAFVPDVLQFYAAAILAETPVCTTESEAR